MTNRKPPVTGDPRSNRAGQAGQKQSTEMATPRGGSAPVRRGPAAETDDRRVMSFGAASPRELAEPPVRSPRAQPALQRGSSEPPRSAAAGQQKRPQARGPKGQQPMPRQARRKPTERNRGKGLKIAGAVALGLLVLLGGAIAAADHLIPVETIRDRMIAEVKTRTGRDLTIGQRPTISIWPRLAVSLTDVTLSQPPAMGAQSFARVSAVEAQAELWPLLSGQVKLDRLVLKEPVIDLRVDRNGRRSWDFASSLPPRPVRYAQAGGTTSDAKSLPRELEDFAKGATKPAGGGSGRSAGLDDLALRSIEIVNGTVRHVDDRTGSAEVVTGITAKVSAADLAAPLAIDGRATWRGKEVATRTSLAPFRAVIDERAMTVDSVSKGQGFEIAYGGTIVPGAAAQLDGKVALKVASIQDLSAWLGRPVGGGIANGPLDLTATAKIDGAGATLQDFKATLEGMVASGTLAVGTTGARPKITGVIQMTALYVDQFASVRLLDGQAREAPRAAPVMPVVPAAKPGSINDLLKTQPKAQVRGFTGRPGWSDEALDLAVLGLVDADVKLGFGALTGGKMRAGKGQVTLALVNKVARVTIEDLQLYEGRAKGVITADGTNGAAAVVGANLSLDGVSALDLMRDAGGVDIVAGKARISTALAGQGRSERQIVETLTGKAEIAMGNGALIGISIPKVLQALSQGRQPSFERVPTDKTDFSELAGSVNIVNGVAQNQDLRFTTAQVKVTGAGTINLPARTIDYVAKPKLAGPQSIQVGQMTLNVGNVDVPVRVVGSFDKISVAPDLGGVVKNPNQALDAIKQLDKKELEATAKGVLNGDPASKAKARDFLKNLLK